MEVGLPVEDPVEVTGNKQCDKTRTFSDQPASQ